MNDEQIKHLRLLLSWGLPVYFRNVGGPLLRLNGFDSAYISPPGDPAEPVAFIDGASGGGYIALLVTDPSRIIIMHEEEIHWP